MRSSHTPAPILALVAALVLGACSSTSIQLTRDLEDFDTAGGEAEASSPDGFTERFGEPDEWRNEEWRGKLQMTAVWKCLEGEWREVTWRLLDAGAGARRWTIVNEISREGECD